MPHRKLGMNMWVMYMIGRLPGHRIRRFLYKWMLNFVFPGSSVIYGGAEIRNPAGLIIGERTIVGHRAILDARNGLDIGNNVNISTGVWIWTRQHDPQDPDFKEVGGKVVIGDYVWLSCRTIILPGVTIGKGCVVAAGAVVTKNTADWTIVGGVPASVIGNRNSNVNYKLEGYVPFV